MEKKTREQKKVIEKLRIYLSKKEQNGETKHQLRDSTERRNR